MSFSQEVKEELLKQRPKARHCIMAELAAMAAFDGSFENGKMIFAMEEEGIAKKRLFLLGKVLDKQICDKLDEADSQKIIEILKLNVSDPSMSDGLIIQQPCCKRAFLRGAFLCSGSITDPAKSYQIEIACRSINQAYQLVDIMAGFDVEARITTRKNMPVVYLKEGAAIVDLLNIMEAPVALMNFENARIIRGMRGQLNRAVNCEAANIGKSVKAGSKQIDDIKYIEKTVGLSYLPESLQEIAKLRLDQPDVPLKELGEMLDPPIGKSGVNHRLRRISQIANQAKNKEI